MTKLKYIDLEHVQKFNTKKHKKTRQNDTHTHTHISVKTTTFNTNLKEIISKL